MGSIPGLGTKIPNAAQHSQNLTKVYQNQEGKKAGRKLSCVCFLTASLENIWLTTRCLSWFPIRFSKDNNTPLVYCAEKFL